MEKFIIIGLPRSGTTLAVQMLNDHRLIRCEGQIFAPRWRDQLNNPEFFFRKIFPLAYAQKRASNSATQIYGFKLIFNEIFFLNRALSKFSADGWRLIFISRRNHLRQAISLILARKQSKWHQRYGTSSFFAPEHIEPKLILQELKRLQSETEKLQSYMVQYPHISLVYEADLQDYEKQKSTLNRICDYFSIDRMNPNPKLIKMHSDPIQSYIQNYQEIEGVLRGTEYEPLLLAD